MSIAVDRGRNVRALNRQPRPTQLRRTTARAGIPRRPREVACVCVPLTDQSARISAWFGSGSSYRPHGGFAFTTRPGRQVATKLANRVPGSWAVIVYTPAGTLLHTTPPSFEEAVWAGSGTTFWLKYTGVGRTGVALAVAPATPCAP